MKTAIVICTRASSRRVPKKPLVKIGDKRLIDHLIDRVSKSGLPVIVACPNEDKGYFWDINSKLYTGFSKDPMKRMLYASEGYDNVIRISHDKIFVDHEEISNALEVYKNGGHDYLYSSYLTDGSGFEIISRDVLREACCRWENIEHISYAIKNLAKNKINFRCKKYSMSDYRLLIDYPEDLALAKHLIYKLGENTSLEEVIDYLNESPEWIRSINKLPTVTIYTCAYNAEKYIIKTIESVSSIKNVNFEYIIIDDCSSDDTLSSIYFAIDYFKMDNVKVIQNSENIGLAASSNIALKNARGKFICRIDADDFFLEPCGINVMLDAMCDNDVIYPDNYFGDFVTIQKGNEKHHVGGALFRTKAINNFKFNEKLRNLEGLDFFGRSKGAIKVGYVNYPVFYYRQHSESLTRNNLDHRAKLEVDIKQAYGV